MPPSLHSGISFVFSSRLLPPGYSECLGAARGPILSSWTGVAILLTFTILYFVPVMRQKCCQRESWSVLTTRILYASCFALQLVAVICFRVGYAVLRTDVNAACCHRTDFSAVGALRTTQKDSQHGTIWDTYCTMTSCACSWDSAAEPGGKFITGVFFWASVAVWALSVLAIAYQQIMFWRVESSASPSSAGTEMATSTATATTATAWKATE